MIKFDDVSVESMLDDLFDNRATTFEAEELDKEIVEELTEEEQEILDGPTDEEDGADETELAEESVRLHGEIQLMNLAMRTAEEYIWNVSEEAEGADKDAEKKQNILKKFWEWLKSALSKIATMLVTTFKRAQVWLAGDMKRIVKWAKENSKDLSGILSGEGAKVTRKMVVIKGSFGDIVKAMEASTAKGSSVLSGALTKLQSGKGDAELASMLKELADGQSVKSLSARFYGEKPETKDVTIVEFNKKFDIVKGLSEKGISDTKTTMKTIQTALKDAKKAMAAVKGNAKVEASEVAGVKALGSALHKYINASSTEAFWVLQLHVKLVKDAYIFAKKAVAANKAGSKKDDK